MLRHSGSAAPWQGHTCGIQHCHGDLSDSVAISEARAARAPRQAHAPLNPAAGGGPGVRGRDGRRRPDFRRPGVPVHEPRRRGDSDTDGGGRLVLPVSGPGALSIRPRERPAARSGRSVVRAGRDSAGRAAAGGLGGLGLAELAEGLPDSDEHLRPRAAPPPRGAESGAGDATGATAGAVAGAAEASKQLLNPELPRDWRERERERERERRERER